MAYGVVQDICPIDIFETEAAARVVQSFTNRDLIKSSKACASLLRHMQTYGFSKHRSPNHGADTLLSQSWHLTDTKGADIRRASFVV
jgi:hypothetical protein